MNEHYFKNISLKELFGALEREEQDSLLNATELAKKLDKYGEIHISLEEFITTFTNGNYTDAETHLENLTNLINKLPQMRDITSRFDSKLLNFHFHKTLIYKTLNKDSFELTDWDVVNQHYKKATKLFREANSYASHIHSAYSSCAFIIAIKMSEKDLAVSEKIFQNATDSFNKIHQPHTTLKDVSEFALSSLKTVCENQINNALACKNYKTAAIYLAKKLKLKPNSNPIALPEDLDDTDRQTFFKNLATEIQGSNCTAASLALSIKNAEMLFKFLEKNTTLESMVLGFKEKDLKAPPEFTLPKTLKSLKIYGYLHCSNKIIKHLEKNETLKRVDITITTKIHNKIVLRPLINNENLEIITIRLPCSPPLKFINKLLCQLNKEQNLSTINLILGHDTSLAKKIEKKLDRSKKRLQENKTLTSLYINDLNSSPYLSDFFEAISLHNKTLRSLPKVESSNVKLNLARNQALHKKIVDYFLDPITNERPENINQVGDNALIAELNKRGKETRAKIVFNLLDHAKQEGKPIAENLNMDLCHMINTEIEAYDLKKFLPILRNPKFNIANTHKRFTLTLAKYIISTLQKEIPSTEDTKQLVIAIAQSTHRFPLLKTLLARDIASTRELFCNFLACKLKEKHTIEDSFNLTKEFHQIILENIPDNNNFLAGIQNTATKITLIDALDTAHKIIEKLPLRIPENKKLEVTLITAQTLYEKYGKQAKNITFNEDLITTLAQFTQENNRTKRTADGSLKTNTDAAHIKQAIIEKTLLPLVPIAPQPNISSSTTTIFSPILAMPRSAKQSQDNSGQTRE